MAEADTLADSEPPTGETDGARPFIEEVLAALSQSRRRRVIEHLNRTPDGMATKSELAELIASEENGVPPSELNSQQRKRVYIALHQVHLDTLESVGLIEHDEREGVARANDRTRGAERIIEDVEAHLNGETPGYSREDVLRAIAYTATTVASVFTAGVLFL